MRAGVRAGWLGWPVVRGGRGGPAWQATGWAEVQLAWGFSFPFFWLVCFSILFLFFFSVLLNFGVYEKPKLHLKYF